METANLQLATTCEQRSKPTEQPKSQLIREWLAKLALNAGQALDATALAVYQTIWEEGFEDLPYSVLEAAFKKVLKVCKFWPIKVADVREHAERAKGNTSEEEAARKWEQVLSYAVRRSPDITEKNPPRISEHTRRAINAAGGLDFLRECDRESLQWARKRFIDAYIRYADLQHDEYLLPPGEARDLLAGFAETKALPSTEISFEELHARGLAYAQELKESGCEQPNIKRAIRAVARELTPRPPMRSIEEQKRILREKGFLPELQSAEVSVR